MNSTILYVVGQYKKEVDGGAACDFQGVFEDKEVAERFCIDETYFVGPVTLNESFPHSTVCWPGCYYPKALK